MTAQVAYADVEQLLVGALAAQFTASRVCTELPAGDSSAWTNPSIIQVVRVAGVDPVLSLDQSSVDIDCYAATRSAATALAALVRAYMRTGLVGYSRLNAVVAAVSPLVGPGWRPYNNTSVRRVGFTDLVTLHNHL